MSFRLNHKLHQPRNSSQESFNKQIIRKYYGKKVVYLENHRDIPSALHKSRLLRSISLKGGSCGSLKFKCKGDLVIIGSQLSFKEVYPAKTSPHFLMYFNRANPLPSLVLKKFFKGCCEMSGDMRLGLGPLRFMLGLKQISLDIQTRSDIEKLAKQILSFRCLEALKLRYVDPNYPTASSGSQSSSQNKARWLFSRIHKLPRLKEFKLETSHRTIESYFSEVQGDLENKKNFKGKTHVKMYFAWDFLGNKKSKALGYFLRDAEALKIDCGGESRPCKNKEYCSEKKKEKSNKRNTVEILSNFGCKEVNVKEVVSYCESLETLYVKLTQNEITWKPNPDFSRAILRLDSLKNVTLDFSVSKLDPKVYTPEENRQRNDEVKFNNALLNMLSYFKENCHALQAISLFLCLAKIDDQTRLPEFFNQIKENNKIKKLELCIEDKLSLISSQILLPLNKNLESFGIYACSPSEEYKEDRLSHSIEWDNIFSRNEEDSPKKACISAPVSLKNFSTGFLESSESPKMLEALNANSQSLTFDLIYDLLSEVIEKEKHLKKLVISTGIAKQNTYLQKNEWTSEALNQQKRIESLFGRLKGSNMEKILIGKLNNFPSDFLVYNKELEIKRI